MIQESDKPGKLDVEKAKKLGVKPGPDLGLLKSGKSVIAVGTDQEVKPEDVLGEPIKGKEVCNGGVACSLLKLGSLKKTVTASLFHSGLHSSSLFFVEKTTQHELLPS